jgi:hypothetical protein
MSNLLTTTNILISYLLLKKMIKITQNFCKNLTKITQFRSSTEGENISFLKMV